MAFIDDLGKNISQSSQNAAKRARDYADVSRLQNLISEQDRIISNELVSVGKIYFDKHSDNPEPEYAGMFDRIKSAELKKDEYKAEIRRIKGMLLCPKCKSALPAGTVFCNYCGTKLISDTDAGGSFCTKCGTKLGKDQAFCTVCGCKADNDAKIHEEPKGNICPKCGKTVSEGAAFCTACGAKLSQPAEPYESDETVNTFNEPPVVSSEPEKSPETADNEEIKPETKKCFKCGKELSLSAVFCTGCGAKLSQPAEPYEGDETVNTFNEPPVVSSEPEKSTETADNEVSIPETKKCFKCGKELSLSAVFCTGCGAKLSQPAEPYEGDETVNTFNEPPVVSSEPEISPETADYEVSASETKKCFRCGKEVFSFATFCTGCGANLSRENPAVSEGAEPLKKEEMSSVQSKQDNKMCPVCHKELPNNTAFCTACGAKLTDDCNSFSQQNASVKQCPRCSRVLSTESSFCTGCGYKF